MIREHTFSGDGISALFLNTIQSKGTGVRPGTQLNDLGSMGTGADGLIWCADSSGIAANNQQKIDISIDWRDRIIWGIVHYTTDANKRFGQSDDYLLTGDQSDFHWWMGYTGTGGYKDGSGGAVSAGNPPTNSSGPPLSYYIGMWTRSTYGVTAPADVRMYANPTTGSLNLYNNTGSNQFPSIIILGTGKTGKR